MANIAVAAVLEAVPKFAVHVSVVVPHPDVMVSPEMLLVRGVTTSAPVPVRVNITGAMAELTVTLCVAPDVSEIVGGAGLVTTTATGNETVRLAPSLTTTAILAVPYDPVAGVTVSVHDVVGFPQVEGDIATVAEPLEVNVTDGDVDTASAPVPPTANETTAGAPPATIDIPSSPVKAGAGIAASAPNASTRP